jgi:uncharacterized protein YcfL
MMKIYAWISVILAIAFGGCTSSAPTTVEKHGSEYRVVANSLLLDNHIRVVERNTRLVNGLLEVQVRGQSVTDKDVQFEYRFVWLEKDGMRLDTEMTTWKPLALHANEVALMTGIAPTPQASDFLLAIRFAKQSRRW